MLVDLHLHFHTIEQALSDSQNYVAALEEEKKQVFFTDYGGDGEAAHHVTTDEAETGSPDSLFLKYQRERMERRRGPELHGKQQRRFNRGRLQSLVGARPRDVTQPHITMHDRER